MKKGKASCSATSTTLFRALESIKPANQRILYDPYAIQFLSGAAKILLNTRFLISGRLLNRIMQWFISRIIPTGMNYVVVRTRYIDDYLDQCIEDGIEQLVILGAGYDSRAFRFTALMERAKVFEVDHPDSQKNKKEKVKNIFGDQPEHVIYVPVDFETEKLDEKLVACGYDRNLKTLFIWEGVTIYITPAAVDGILTFVASNSGKGSTIIFDYVYQSVIEGRVKEAERLKKQAARAGESFKFGIAEGAVEEFLSSRTFCNVKDINAKSLEDKYFRGTGRRSRPFYGIVYAAVKLPEGGN